MRFGLTPMRARDANQSHRAASPLELFFDLVFVVAVSIASAQLHHAETTAHLADGVLHYLMVFFAIWWAWMNFTWFATAFDTDDWLYRLLTLLQMSGVLVLAAGIPAAMNDGDFAIMTFGYAIMRLALVPQWIRAAVANPQLRRTALRYAIGITIVQLLWIARLSLVSLSSELNLAVFVVLVLAELFVPVFAELRRPTPWHPEHITERYGLFTIILLGESILASANSIVDALAHTEHIAPLIGIAATGMVLAAGMWWIYFAREHREHIELGFGRAILFGYGHYFIFAAAGAFSAGIEVAIDLSTGDTKLEPILAAATLTVPVALFVLGVWALTLRHVLGRTVNSIIAALAVLLACSALTPFSPLISALCMIVIVASLEVSRTRAHPPLSSPGELARAH